MGWASRTIVPLAILAIGAVFPSAAGAGTLVRVNTSLGNIDFQLYDDAAPETVNNFLNYVVSGRYFETFIHRSARNSSGGSFVVQAGGYRLSDLGHINTYPAVVNEFNRPNSARTISMAKVGNNPNSATSEWFVNTQDNSSNLDNQNGGFTVFASVDDASWAVVNQIAALKTPYDYDPDPNRDNQFVNTDAESFYGIAYSAPIKDFTQAEFESGSVTTSDLIKINSTIVIDTWQPAYRNASDKGDADNSGNVDVGDLIALVELLFAGGSKAAPTAFVGPLYYDVDGNEYFNSLDVDALADRLEQPQGSSGLLSFRETSLTAFAVPEPASAVSAAIGLSALLWIGRRRRRSS